MVDGHTYIFLIVFLGGHCLHISGHPKIYVVKCFVFSIIEQFRIIVTPLVYYNYIVTPLVYYNYIVLKGPRVLCFCYGTVI